MKIRMATNQDESPIHDGTVLTITADGPIFAWLGERIGIPPVDYEEVWFTREEAAKLLGQIDRMVPFEERRLGALGIIHNALAQFVYGEAVHPAEWKSG